MISEISDPAIPDPSFSDLASSAPRARRPWHPLLRSSVISFTTSAVIVAIAAGLIGTGEIINRTSERPRNLAGCDFGPGFGVMLIGGGVGLLSVPPGLVGTVYLMAYGIGRLRASEQS